MVRAIFPVLWVILPWQWWLIPRRQGLLGRLMVDSCMLVGGRRDRFLMRTPYRTLDRRRFGMRMVRMLFLPPAFFLCGFMPLCLELTTGFSHRWVPTVSVWGFVLPRLMLDSRLCKLSLKMVFVTLSWSTTITPSFLEFAEEDCFRHTYVLYPCDVTSPAQLHLKLKQNGLCTWQADSIEDFLVWHVVSPFYVKDGALAALVKPHK